MKIKQVARLTGITVRTLHYYDEIGLLPPSSICENGYRIYDEKALDVLQQILFFKELDFPLNEIKQIIKNPNYDKTTALQHHKKLLQEKQNRLTGLINLVDKTLKGEKVMSFKEFDMTDIEKQKQKYAEEVKQRWGNTDAYAQSEKSTSAFTANDWEMAQGEGNEILKQFGEICTTNPESEQAQQLVKAWQNYITKTFYNCTKEILSCLGQMYVGDERFTENIDKNGIGTAEFMSKAIEYYCK